MPAPRTPEVEAFLAAVADLCKQHNLSLSHEDGHGAFQVEHYSDYNTEWLMQASDETNKGRQMYAKYYGVPPGGAIR